MTDLPRNGDRHRELLDSQELRLILEQAYLLVDEGHAVDWKELSKGDPELAEMARSLLDEGSRAADFLTGIAAPATGPEARHELLGDYELLRLIGVGGMSRVYEARQRSLSRRVALKVLKAEHAAEERCRARFKREAEVTAALVHPGIVPIHEVGEVDGRAYIAMPLLEGQNLSEIERPLPPEEVARLGVALAEALHHAHVAGVIHRDVKPANVMIVDGQPVLLDFGLAWALGRVDLTDSDMAPGTLVYMSPEQLDGQSGLDPRSDLFSLGGTLWELLSGEAPFMAPSPGEVVRRIGHDDPAPLGLPRRHRDLETILLRALDKDRDRRFTTAANMAADLRRYLAGQPISSRRISVVGRIGLRAARNPRATAALLVALIAVSLLIGSLLWTRLDQDRRRTTARERARTALGEGRLLATLDLGSPFADDPEIAGLLARARGRLRAEDIEDLVIDFGNLYEAGHLRDLLDGDDLDVEGNLEVLAAAAHMLDDREREEELVSRLEARPASRRSARAFRLLLEGGLADENRGGAAVSLPEPSAGLSGPSIAREHCFTALAMTLADVALDDRRQELERALERDPGLFAARHLAGRVAFQRGEHEAALAYYRGLDRPDRRPAFVARAIAQCQIALGRHDEALALVESEARSRDPNVLRLELDLAARGVGSRSFADLLAEARGRWPDQGHFDLVAAVRSLNDGDLDHARASATIALDKRLSRHGRAEARFVLIQAELMVLGLATRLGNLPVGDEHQTRVVALRDELLELLGDLPEGDPRGLEARLLEFRLRVLLGDLAGAERDLDQLADRHVDDLGIILFQARMLDARLMASLGPENRLAAELRDRHASAVALVTRRLAPLIDAAGDERAAQRRQGFLLLSRLQFLVEDWAAFDALQERFSALRSGLEGAEARALTAMVNRAAKLR